MSVDDDIRELEYLDSDMSMALPLIGNSLHEALNFLQTAYEWQPALQVAIHELKMLQIYHNRETDEDNRRQHAQGIQDRLDAIKVDVNISTVRDALRQVEAILADRQQAVRQLMNNEILRG